MNVRSLRVDILTIFPEMFAGPLEHGVIGRAVNAKKLQIEVHDIRAWSRDRHRTVDDYAYGGGSGMVMKPEPLAGAVEHARGPTGWVVLLSPQGELLSHRLAEALSRREHLVLICGRYEGIDERVRTLFVNQEISIGDYVLAGGELPAMVLVEAVARLVPGVVGKEESVTSDSHVQGLLEHPHYTRPQSFRGLEVPEVLLSGNHEAVAEWRRLESLRRTLLRRPDLLIRRGLAPADARWLETQEPEAFAKLVHPEVNPDTGLALEKGVES